MPALEVVSQSSSFKEAAIYVLFFACPPFPTVSTPRCTWRLPLVPQNWCGRRTRHPQVSF